MTMRFAAIALASLLVASTALAEECPDTVPDDSGVRRQQAKKWFSKGEESTKAGDDLAALKAYQCSLKFVPHGFTAFNIGQIAERVGDLELAVSSYNQYLLLVPDAVDGAEVTRKIGELKQRLAKVKRQERALASSPPVVPVEPAPVAEAQPIAPPPPPAAAPPTSSPEQSVTREHTGISLRTWAWISYGGAAAFLTVGLVTNLMARSKMDTCRSTYYKSGQPAAQSSCDTASALAYTSYAMFGLGGAAAALGTFFVLRPTDSTEVAFAPLPEGGAALRLAGRY